MSNAEGLMWRLEADPMFASSFVTVTLLDQPADMARLRRRMSRAVVLVPRLRQRVLDRPLGLAPVWVDVAEVDIDHHVRSITLPAPGTIRQLLDMATELLVQPFDRERPLWEFLAVDGLGDGQGAFIQKMHHTISDSLMPFSPSVMVWCIFCTIAPRPSASPSTTVNSHSGRVRSKGSPASSAASSYSCASEPGRASVTWRKW